MNNPKIIPDKSNWPINIYFALGFVYAFSFLLQDLFHSSFWLLISLVALICIFIFGIFIGWIIIIKKRIVLLPFIAWRIRNREKKKGIEAAKKYYEQYANRKNQLAIAFLFSSPGLGFVVLMLLLLGKSLF